MTDEHLLRAAEAALNAAHEAPKKSDSWASHSRRWMAYVAEKEARKAEAYYLPQDKAAQVGKN